MQQVLKREDNVLLRSPEAGALGRLRKSDVVELCCLRPLGDGDNIGLSGWLHKTHTHTHTHTHTDKRFPLTEAFTAYNLIH